MVFGRQNLTLKGFKKIFLVESLVLFGKTPSCRIGTFLNNKLSTGTREDAIDKDSVHSIFITDVIKKRDRRK